MEGVRHSPGRGPQALEAEPRRLDRSHSQLVERKAEPGVEPHANHHDRQYAGHPARRVGGYLIADQWVARKQEDPRRDAAPLVRLVSVADKDPLILDLVNGRVLDGADLGVRVNFVLR